MTAALDRRSMLASTLAMMATGALPVAAVTAADPIFAALAAWEASDRDVIRVYAETSGDDSAEASALCDVQDWRRDALEKALNATVPTTLAGALALARYYAATASDPDGSGLTHLVEVLGALARASPS